MAVGVFVIDVWAYWLFVGVLFVSAVASLMETRQRKREMKASKEAERYRWLRDAAYHATAGENGKMTWCVTGEGCSTVEPIFGDALDAAVDAMLETPNV